MASTAAVVIFTVLAVGELIADKLPSAPARTKPPGSERSHHTRRPFRCVHCRGGDSVYRARHRPWRSGRYCRRVWGVPGPYAPCEGVQRSGLVHRTFGRRGDDCGRTVYCESILNALTARDSNHARRAHRKVHRAHGDVPDLGWTCQSFSIKDRRKDVTQYPQEPSNVCTGSRETGSLRSFSEFGSKRSLGHVSLRSIFCRYNSSRFSNRCMESAGLFRAGR